jgi:hypothetical protein
LEGKSCKQKVAVDLNTRFADIKNIKAALDKQTELQASWKARDPAREAEKNAAILQKADMSKFMFEFQLGVD